MSRLTLCRLSILPSDPLGLARGGTILRGEPLESHEVRMGFVLDVRPKNRISKIRLKGCL